MTSRAWSCAARTDIKFEGSLTTNYRLPTTKMQPLFIGLGELLWDLLPSGRQLGGAPANFAYIASLLGNRAAVISRVGDDDLGREARDRCSSLGLDISHLHSDPVRPERTVNVKFDSV